MALRSEIIFCKLLKASPPPAACCFLLAASLAACRAVFGADTAACKDFGAESALFAGAEVADLTFADEFDEVGRGGAAAAVVLMGAGFLAFAPFFLFDSASGFDSAFGLSPSGFACWGLGEEVPLFLAPVFSFLPSPLASFGPSLIPPLMVVVGPDFFTRFGLPSLPPLDECELLLETLEDPCVRPLRDEDEVLERLDAAELDLEPVGGGARVLEEYGVGWGARMGVGSDIAERGGKWSCPAAFGVAVKAC
jgi:hypothetical protein